jgi:phosphoglycolate phosphatase
LTQARTFDLVIFDFDGTLGDSAGWFRSILPDIARRFGFRCPGDAELEVMRHQSPREVMRVLKIPGWKLPLIAMHVRRRAEQADAVALFDGIPELIASLAARGVKIAVVSSNSERNVRRTLGPEICGRIGVFSCGAAMMGKARHFRDVLEQLKVAPERALGIGDELRDILAAKAVGIRAVAVGWGMGSVETLQAAGPAHCFATVAALKAFLVAEQELRS